MNKNNHKPKHTQHFVAVLMPIGASIFDAPIKQNIRYAGDTPSTQEQCFNWAMKEYGKKYDIIDLYEE